MGVSKMNNIGKSGLAIGIVGGLGLGILLGSGFPGQIIMFSGAGLIVIFLIVTIGMSLKKKIIK